MLIRLVVTLLSCLALLSPLNVSAGVYLNDGNKEENLLSIENEIVQVAESNGLDKSNIHVIWTETATGGYIGSIQCIGSTKCNRSEVTLSFTKEELQKIASSHLQKQLLTQKLHSLFTSSVR